MRHSPSRRRSGFSLLELLLTIGVVGAVAMISVRSIGDTIRRDRVAKVSAILSSDIEQAFAIAARQRLPVRMVIDQTNKSFTIVDRNTPTLIYKTRSFARTGAYALDSIASNRDFIDIMPNGLATDTPEPLAHRPVDGRDDVLEVGAGLDRRPRTGEQPMSARMKSRSRLRVRSGRPRAGMTLIEVIVACSLLALTFTSLTALSVKLAARNRSNASVEQRTATFFEQINRVESMPYDSLTKYLTNDSVLVGKSYYVWNYTIDAESLSTSGRQRYRRITLTVIPRADSTATQIQTIRRYKAPFTNPLFK